MANTPQPLPTFERLFIRPILHTIYPKWLSERIITLKMRVQLYFSPIKYQFHKGNVEMGSRLCVFVSFQPRGILPTTWKYLQHLKENLGYSIVLISNCPLQKKDIPALQALCIEVIERDNIGYDFGAYKDGILRYMEKLGNKFDELETLLIANDSVIGPIYDMSPIHDQMQTEDCDFWGMNDLFEDQDLYNFNTKSIPHPCSYFVCFKNNLLKTEAFKNLWKFMVYPSGRKIAIRNEKKLGQYFLNNKFSYSVFVKKEDIINYISENKATFDYDMWFTMRHTNNIDKIFVKNYHNVVAHNHTNTICPMLTLVHFGMPLMKRDLIKRNVVNMSIFKAILNKHEKQLTQIVTKEEILDEMGLNPRTANSIFKWNKYII